jgi:phospholipid/cholesterol/gamma-HCH transport system permease protein
MDLETIETLAAVPLLTPARKAAAFGRAFLDHLGGVAQLGGRAFRLTVRGHIDPAALVTQVEAIGLASLSVAALTAVFSSMVMAVQFAVQMDRFGAKEWVGSVVSISLLRELGPVLTALMVGGRVGAGIAAELGSMSVTEQVDALRSMGADPVEALVVPRVLAAVLAMPLLTAFANALGILAAMVISLVAYNINMTYFFNAMLRSAHIADLTGGLVKTLFFGLAIGLIACYEGLTTVGGTVGVGRATTRTVVVASITVLITDFILTNILVGFGL